MPLPPPLYYLYNYRRLLSWVGARYQDLLSPAERDFIDTLDRLPEASQALLVRMISRKGSWFRLSRLHYAEIGDSRLALAPLVQAGLVQVRPACDLDTLFNLFTRPELARWLGYGAGKKSQWLEQARQQLGAGVQSLDHWQQAGLPAACADDLLALTVMPLCENLNLLFFGNLRQSLSEFVLSDLGIFNYETLALDQRSRSFQQREQLEQYRRLFAVRDAFEADQAPAPLLQQLGPRPALAWLAHRYDRLQYRLAYRAEQLGQLDAALQVYADNPLPDARPRQARLLEKCGRLAEALACAERALAAPRNEAEQQQLQRSLPRLQKANGRPVRRPEKFSPLEQPLQLMNSGERVELQVRAALHSGAAPVFWCENALWTGLVGLLLWPAIFAPLPGAFFHPFQAGPKDLHQADFVAQRQPLIEQNLALLEGDAWRAELQQRYRAKQGIANPLVNWAVFDAPLLALALECVPASLLAALTRRLLFDLPANRAGFPDLVQFYPATQHFRLIEVKGPGDKLQDNQQRWLQFFAGQQIEARVIYVTWQAP